jgi:response regulator RpfG family c-di-GMP phosphodiesterase
MALNSAPPARPKLHNADADNDGETNLEKETPSPSSIALVPPLHPLSIPAENLPTNGNANGKSLAQRSPTGRSRVLLIQKSHAVMEFQRTVLSALNAEVITAGSGVEALALLQSDDVHAVILDDELEGEWRGKKLLVWIQENRPDLRNRLLMTVSPVPKEETRDMIERLGIAHVTKPLQILDLFAGVKQMLGFSPEALDRKFLN